MSEYLGELDTWPPVTMLYRLDDGRHVAVSRLEFATAAGTVVFLTDESGAPIDADGDPSNGLTPLVPPLPAGVSIDEVVEAINEHAPAG